jgi:hypothetical protein
MRREQKNSAVTVLLCHMIWGTILHSHANVDDGSKLHTQHCAAAKKYQHDMKTGIREFACGLDDGYLLSWKVLFVQSFMKIYNTI